MLTFLGVALLVYASMHLYALSKVWLALPHSWALGLALILAGIVLTASPFLVHFMERQGWHRATVATAWIAYSWMGYLVLFFCTGLLIDFGHVLATLLNLRWPLNPATNLATVGVVALAVAVYGFIEARQLRVERVTITTPKLAAGQVVTVAQISDLHLGMMHGEKFLARVLAQLRELKPDILVATGDIVDGGGDDLDALARQFHGYAPPLGAYAVTGNHEYFGGLEKSLRFFRDAGFTVLRGDSVGVGGIVLAGVDDSTARSPNLALQRPSETALAAEAEHNFIVLLKHQPIVGRDIPFDLQLSGHIHGGQIFPMMFVTRLVYGVDAGLTRLGGGRLLYVNRGAGTWGPPMRVFAPPEITLITIAGANNAPAAKRGPH